MKDNNKVKLRHPADIKDSSKRLQHILRSAKKYTIRNEDFSNLESVRKLRAMCKRKQQTTLFLPRYSVAIYLGVVTIIMVLLVLCNQMQTSYHCRTNSSQETLVHTVRPRYLLDIASGDEDDITQLCGTDDLDDRTAAGGGYPVMSSTSRLWLHRKR